MKIRFVEPGNLPYRRSFKNLFVYDTYIRTPSQGVMTLATILNRHYDDVLAYSESISLIEWDDVLDADIVFISAFTFSANRGYEIAQRIKTEGKGIVVIGGLHATLNPKEAARYCDYVMVGEGDETIVKFTRAIEEGTSPNFEGLAFYQDDAFIHTGKAPLPHDIDVIPNRHLLYRFKKMAGHNPLWPQVHASRGCPHSCDYCTPVAAFGRGVRMRTPENVVEDIKQAIDFFDKGHHRLAKMLWITDDNFFANRSWAIEVLRLMIEEGIDYNFTIQARYEVGFDDEMLDLLKRAGFSELALGIEFLEDEAFQTYHKTCSYDDILRSVKNIQRHGLRTRGLFIVGADNHQVGVGTKLANFVIENNISGVLIQSMYFIPGTAAYEANKDRLIEPYDWSRCIGKVTHNPRLLSAVDLQKEIIIASKTIYSPKRLFQAILHKRGIERLLFIGEYFWQRDVRRDLKRDLAFLEKAQTNSCKSSI